MEDALRILSGLSSTPASTESRRATGNPAGSADFQQALDQAQGIHFSQHAQKRIATREIQLNDDSLARLASAVDKVQKHGGRESLILMDNMAFVVNVPQRLVVTAMDVGQRGEGVFTNIDSVALADPQPGSATSSFRSNSSQAGPLGGSL